jgi:hypothetical protein
MCSIDTLIDNASYSQGTRFIITEDRDDMTTRFAGKRDGSKKMLFLVGILSIDHRLIDRGSTSTTPEEGSSRSSVGSPFKSAVKQEWITVAYAVSFEWKSGPIVKKWCVTECFIKL